IRRAEACGTRRRAGLRPTRVSSGLSGLVRAPPGPGTLRLKLPEAARRAWAQPTAVQRWRSEARPRLPRPARVLGRLRAFHRTPRRPRRVRAQVRVRPARLRARRPG